jgi:hypothetical protein
MADLVVVVPTRGRPQAAAELAQAFADTSTSDTQLVFAVDADDPERGGYTALMHESHARCPYVIEQPNGTMVTALNLVALTAARDTFAVGFMGDDHCPRTVGWDEQYLQALRELGTGIVYGNDLLQGQNLPTQCAMTSDIIRTLGYMAPPTLQHMYVDNAWLALGTELGRIRYLPDVVVEHLHPIAGKAEWDDGYRRVNDNAVYARDRAMFQAWLRESLPVEAARLRRIAR